MPRGAQHQQPSDRRPIAENSGSRAVRILSGRRGVHRRDPVYAFGSRALRTGPNALLRNEANFPGVGAALGRSAATPLLYALACAGGRAILPRAVASMPGASARSGVGLHFFIAHPSGELPKSITIRILLNVEILIEFRPQCPGSIHHSLCGENGLPSRLGGRDTWGCSMASGTKRCSP